MPSLTPYGEVAVTLAPGDTLVLFSDGVTEAQDVAEEEYGEGRLVALLRAAAGQPPAVLIDLIMAAIDAFAGGAPQFDDITLLVARRT
jgi:sigma-B regulation protein RsbU (phosphoserine phosphatase)